MPTCTRSWPRLSQPDPAWKRPSATMSRRCPSSVAHTAARRLHFCAERLHQSPRSLHAMAAVQASRSRPNEPQTLQAARSPWSLPISESVRLHQRARRARGDADMGAIATCAHHESQSRASTTHTQRVGMHAVGGLRAGRGSAELQGIYFERVHRLGDTCAKCAAWRTVAHSSCTASQQVAMVARVGDVAVSSAVTIAIR